MQSPSTAAATIAVGSSAARAAIGKPSTRCDWLQPSSRLLATPPQIALLLVLFVTAFGLAVGVRDAGHIGLESLLVLAPDAVRRKMELLIHALVGVFGVVMAWQCSVLALSVIAAAIVTMPPSVDEVVPQIAPQADLDTTLVLRATRKLVDDLQAAQAHGRG